MGSKGPDEGGASSKTRFPFVTFNFAGPRFAPGTEGAKLACRLLISEKVEASVPGVQQVSIAGSHGALPQPQLPPQPQPPPPLEQPQLPPPLGFAKCPPLPLQVGGGQGVQTWSHVFRDEVTHPLETVITFGATRFSSQPHPGSGGLQEAPAHFLQQQQSGPPKSIVIEGQQAEPQFEQVLQDILILRCRLTGFFR